MKKTYSQKVALLLAIVSSILLVPALFGLFYSSILVTTVFPFTAGVWFAFIVGTIMLVNYFRHSNGSLEAKQVKNLWISTAIYNGILAIIYSVIAVYAFSGGDSSVLLIFALALWCISATILPITALVSIKNNDNVR